MSMKIGDTLPKFDGATEWLNGTLEDAELKPDQPVLVYFWAVSCGICKQNMPQLQELESKYKPLGLQTVAIHMPRYEADSDIESVRDTLNSLGIDDVCAVDNKHLLKDAFQNEQGWVPVYFLFDKDGKLKSRAAGEYGVGVLRTALDRMFPEATGAKA
ncbi:MAG: TlpA family protein disulfide reductase [Pyrinomonadaceae bacterium]